MNLSKLLQGAYYGRYEKTVHFLLSIIILIILNYFLRWWIAAILILLIGLLKEMGDLLIRKAKFDSLDLLANVAGIIIGLSLLSTLNLLT